MVRIVASDLRLINDKTHRDFYQPNNLKMITNSHHYVPARSQGPWGRRAAPDRPMGGRFGDVILQVQHRSGSRNKVQTTIAGMPTRGRAQPGYVVKHDHFEVIWLYS